MCCNSNLCFSHRAEVSLEEGEAVRPNCKMLAGVRCDYCTEYSNVGFSSQVFLVCQKEPESEAATETPATRVFPIVTKHTFFVLSYIDVNKLT